MKSFPAQTLFAYKVFDLPLIFANTWIGCRSCWRLFAI